MSAALETIAEVLRRFPEVRWDSFVVVDERSEFYGWWTIGAGDAFFSIRFTGLDDATPVGWLVSDKTLDQEIAERLGFSTDGAHRQRVSDVFGQLVPGAARS